MHAKVDCSIMIYDSKNIKIKHIDNYIYHQYLELVDERDWKEGFKAGIEYAIKNNVKNWLNDLSGFYGTDCSNVIWLNDNVNKKLEEVGFPNRIVFVAPKPEFQQATRSMDFYIEFSNASLKNSPCNVVICKFSNLEDAKTWLSF
jgi:hypothetical protein